MTAETPVNVDIKAIENIDVSETVTMDQAKFIQKMSASGLTKLQVFRLGFKKKFVLTF